MKSDKSRLPVASVSATQPHWAPRCQGTGLGHTIPSLGKKSNQSPHLLVGLLLSGLVEDLAVQLSFMEK